MATATTTAAETSDLQYLQQSPPDKGAVADIAEGVRWLRMPLPFLLGHINLWLLDDGDGWTIVDTGVSTSLSREVWERVFDTELDGRPVTRVIVTHMHPDHAGLAGWLCARWDVPLWMTRTEYLTCRVLAADTGHAAPREGVRFYREAGFDSAQLDRYQERFGMFGRVMSPLPNSYRRLRGGETLRIGEHYWQVMIGRGHSPEHACLFSPALNLVISGDQVLPTISSNVGVWPTEPQANPLADWLKSCERLATLLPDDVLVLPAHGRPFRGARARLSTLIADHEIGLEKLHARCESPQRAVDVFDVLFRSPIDDNNLIMAVGESVAHLNYLVAVGRLTSDVDDDGVRWYRQTG